MTIYKQWSNPPKAKAEKKSGPSRTSLAGYQPADQRIQSLLSAGKRLFDANTAAYDIPAGEKYYIDNISVDPTRSKAFDFADASEAMRNVENHVKIVKATQKAQKEQVKPAEKTLEPEKGDGHSKNP